MATLTYNGFLGPKQVTFGTAGTFTAGEPKEVDDNLAAQLMAKGCFDLTPAAKTAKLATSNTED